MLRTLFAALLAASLAFPAHAQGVVETVESPFIVEQARDQFLLGLGERAKVSVLDDKLKQEKKSHLCHLLMAEDGTVAGYAVCFGGFLGLGERMVVVKTATASWGWSTDHGHFLWVEMLFEQLEGGPQFQGCDDNC